MKDKITERFLTYVGFDTESSHNSDTYPTTKKQLELAKYLESECNKIGLTEVSLDEFGYVMASLPSNLDKDIPVIGFVAHMDTSPDCKGSDIRPNIVRNYGGNDIPLNGVTLSPSEFPSMLKCVGKDIITTDGTTLLGADDKAGIAEIMTAMEYLINHPEIKHGKVRIAFTPDEEVGKGCDNFDVRKFGAKFAYTIDGGTLGGIEYETFNAASAKFTITGKSVHPGTAKGIMLNAAAIACEIASLFPAAETPQNTSGYEGFYHLGSIQGGVEHATCSYIIRDHSTEIFNARKDFSIRVSDWINAKYGEGTVCLHLIDSYYNMKDKVLENEYVFSLLSDSLKELSITPVIAPVRGGTDGSRLSFMGLPCPNIFTGCANAHGPYEYVCIDTMEKACEVIIKIIGKAVEL